MTDQTPDTPGDEQSPIQKAVEDLAAFAFEREDVKWLLARLPKETSAPFVTVEYELSILKIITVGWSLTFFLENSPVKAQLTESFWQTVFEFSKGISEATGLMIGKDIDYFQILKDRLDTYINALIGRGDEKEPAEIIGPRFAEACGNAEDVFTQLTGAKMFANTFQRVRRYLQSIGLV